MVYEINRESLASSGTGSFEFNIVAQKVREQFLISNIGYGSLKWC